MAMNVTPFVGTDNFNMETFNNMISQINSGVNSEISDVLAQLSTKAKIQTGSYVGTGTSGANNPCSLTFNFEPILVFISGTQPNPMGGGGTFGGGLFSPSSLSTLYANFGYIFCSNSSCACEYSNTAKIDGYTLYWYHAQDHATNQLNLNGTTYYYVAIG